MAKRYADATLMAMTKADLIKHLRCAERNEDAANEMLNQQAENFRGWKPVVHGKWREVGITMEYHHYTCSACKHNAKSPGRFCPNCGAFMGDDSKVTPSTKQ